VKVPFPRPLYPPDAKSYGKKPSVDGPDIVALKRALCRGGRWGDWDPDSWDDSFNNAISHGNGPNVKNTGLAGFQRQQHIDDTGWFGQKSFDNMRYALISDPSAPHYGEPLFDGGCVQLINEAYEMFGGHEPDDQGETLRVNALHKAKSQVGYAEGANNDNKYGAWYGMNYQPWCAMFCTWSFETTGNSPAFVKGSRYSYVPYIVGDARNGRNGLKITGDPIAGDLVCYDWDWNEEFDHVGIFEKWIGGGQFYAVEGNTSPDSGGSQSNGGGVYRRDRLASTQNTVFVRVAEP
jgi:hypothetical protein